LVFLRAPRHFTLHAGAGGKGGDDEFTIPGSDLNKGRIRRLSHRLANFELSDAVIKGLAERVLINGPSIWPARSLHLRDLCRNSNKPPALTSW